MPRKKKSALADPVDAVRITEDDLASPDEEKPADDEPKASKSGDAESPKEPEGEDKEPVASKPPMKKVDLGKATPKKAADAPKVPDPKPSEAVTQYRVTKDCRASRKGFIVRLYAGKIVSAATHGKDVQEWLDSAGVPYEVVSGE